MREGPARSAFLGALAIIFAAGLTYASIALPRAAAQALNEAFQLPGFDLAVDPYGTGSVVRAPIVRTAGQVSFLLVVVLVAAGLWAERRALAAAGGILFFLPVFGHFAAGMFFLAGLAVLRVAWLPLLGISHDILRLGDIAFVPYAAVVYLVALVGFDVREPLVWSVMGLGMLLFVVGTLDWLQARARGTGTADRRLYRLGRHPQYLGWIVWSHGLMIYSMLHSRLGSVRVNYGMASSLPWLVSAVVIIGVAMLEEVRMRRARGEEYEAYARRTPFLFPLPRPVRAAIALPGMLVLRGRRPERGADVALSMAVYLAILMLLSAPFVILGWPPGGHLAGSHAGWWAFPFNVFPFGG